MEKQLIAIEHEDPKHNDIVVVNWCLGNTCNYSCSYCPSILHDASVPWLDYEIVTAFCGRLLDHYKTKWKSKVYIELTGGEVSHYRQFPDLIRFLKERDAWVGMISNGSRALGWWQDNQTFIDHVCLSFHPESARADHFKRVVEALQSTCTLHVNIMMLPEKFEAGLEMAEWIEKHTQNVSIALQTLLKDFSSETYPYSQTQREILAAREFNITWSRTVRTYRGRLARVFSDGSRELVSAPQLIARNENRWKGWTCFVGMKELAIDFHGTVYRAWCQQGGSLGNVRDRNFNFPESPVRCERSFCHCVLDVMNQRSYAGFSVKN